jgi:hypothetical protein
MATCSRSISDVISAMRSVSSSTDSSDRSCPISWAVQRASGALLIRGQ